MNKIFLLLLSLTLGSSIHAQEWVNLMQDPNATYYQVKDAFDAYWEGREYERGKGYKQYKRWANFVEPRMDAYGNRPKGLDYYMAIRETQNMGRAMAKDNSPWQPLGPTEWESQAWNPGLGRINAIVLDPTNFNTIFVATPAGGLWRSTNAGENWTPLTDHLPSIGASGLAIDPNNNQIMYLATGDGDASDTYSIGVLKSIDGGITWEPTSLVQQVSDQVRCSKILIDPTNSDRLWVATNIGIYRTNNAGGLWSLVLSENIRDIEIHPTDPSIIYASGRRFFRSTNGGTSFSTISDGVPEQSEVSRLAIAVSPDNPDLVYMVAGNESDNGFHGLYRSSDSGISFELRSNTPNILTYSQTGNGEGGQSWYDLAIAVSPENADHVFVGGINVWSSENGGLNWDIKSHWVYPSDVGYTHADIHSLDFYGNALYCGSDGGIFRTPNFGASWTDLSSGLQISQFYRIALSTTDESKVLVAAQDNGTNLFDGSTYVHLLGGDGNGAAINYNNDQIMYSAYPGGSFQKSTNGGQNFNDFNSGLTENGAWVTPLEFHPTNPNILFSAFENVWKNTNNTWESLADLPGNGTLYSLCIAPSNPDVIYTATRTTIYRSTNGGSSWQNINNGLSGMSITAIEVDPENDQRVWITNSGYSANNKVHFSENGGNNWMNISQNLPNIPVNCVSYLNGSNDAIYIGTDAGVFYRDQSLLDWIPFNDGLPNVIVNQIEFFYPTFKIYIATFGRGVWYNDVYDTSSIIPVANFTSDKTVICKGESINYINTTTFNSGNQTWTFEGGAPNTSIEANPTVLYPEAGNYMTKLVAYNENGSDSLIIESYITVLDTIGIETPIMQDFENVSSLPPSGWYPESADEEITWALNQSTGYLSDQCTWIDNFSNTLLAEDFLSSDVYDLTGLDTAIITMRVAYAKRPGSSIERLKVSISTDCGQTWVFKKLFSSSAELPSVPPMTEPFFPANESEWNYFVIDNITPDERVSDFRVQLEWRCNGGNNIFVDDINVTSEITSGIFDQSSDGIAISIFPNPTRDHFRLTTKDFAQGSTSIELRDLQGRLISNLWQGQCADPCEIEVELPKINSGLYLVTLRSEAGEVSRKLTVY